MSRRAIYIYLELTFAFSAVLWAMVIWSGHLNMAFGLVIPVLMWCPALAALVTCRLMGRDFRTIAWQWPQRKYLIAAYFIPLAYTSVSYGLVWAFGLAGWNSQFVGMAVQELGLTGLPKSLGFALCITLMATAGVIENLSTTLGEEIGWRGFLVPELAKDMSFTRVGLVSGLIWAAWHSPLILFADYNVSTNRWYSLVCSSLTCISMSFILAWIRLKSGSIWPAALLHASHNLFVPVVFDNLTRNTGRTLWYTTEFGAALVATSTAFALYFWRRVRDIEDRQVEDPTTRYAVLARLGPLRF
jgi:CAAX protease family protein